LLQVFVSLPGDRYPFSDLEKQQVYRKELVEATASLPGVEAVNLASSVPAPSAGYGSSIWLPDGRRFLNGDPAARSMSPGKHAVSRGHFRVLGLPLRRGRDFDESDGPDSHKVAIVNETMARLLWPGEDPLLHKVRLRSDGPWHEIVGIVGDIPYGSPRNRVKPEVYLSLYQQPAPAFWLLVKTRNDAGLLKKSVAERIRRVDPLVPLEQQTMEEALALSIAETRYLTWALTALAALALVLCGAGVFAVGSFSVARRTFEFGVRIALGARGADIWKLVLTRTLVLTTLGVALGAGGSFLVTRFLESFLYEVERNDPTVLLAASTLLLACSLAAVWAPARRATSVDPSVVLRLERG
jgi:predicted permease